jgi:hypothetical protein
VNTTDEALQRYLRLAEGRLPMPVDPAKHVMHQTALFSTHGRLDCGQDLLCLPSKGDLGRRAQMPSGKASMTESLALRTMRSCHGTWVAGSRVTMLVLFERHIANTYNL